MILKVKGDLDILQMYLQTENNMYPAMCGCYLNAFETQSLNLKNMTMFQGQNVKSFELLQALS